MVKWTDEQRAEFWARRLKMTGYGGVGGLVLGLLAGIVAWSSEAVVFGALFGVIGAGCGWYSGFVVGIMAHYPTPAPQVRIEGLPEAVLEEE